MNRLDPAVAEVRRAVRLALTDLDAGMRVLVACSGGADSLALAAATAFEGQKAGWQVGAIVVDHRIQEESDHVARDVAARLVGLGCDPVDVVTVDVGSDGGPEAAAREARYTALEAAADRHGALVLLGHTLDDQAETVLLGLARGSGTRSLAGMAAAHDPFRRPLLGVRRTVTQRACAAEGLEVWDDPHNADPRFTRVRVRRELLPALENALGPGVAEALARTAIAARHDGDALDQLAANLVESIRDDSGGLDVAALEDSPPALRRRVLRHSALEAGSPPGDLFAVHVDELERLVIDWHGQGPLDLPGRVEAFREQGWIRFTPKQGGVAR